MTSPTDIDVYRLILLIAVVIWHLFRRKSFDESQLGRRHYLIDAALFIFTGGIAIYAWLLKTTAILNRQAQRPISRQFQTGTLVYIFGVILGNIFFHRYFKGLAQSNDGQNIWLLFSLAGSFLTIIWSFEIRRLVMERTHRQYSGVMTFLFSAFYSLYIVRKTFKSRVQKPPLSSRKRLIITSAAGFIGLILMSFPITIGLRHFVFSSIHANQELMKKQAGYWRRESTGSQTYELVYELQEDGAMRWSAVYFSHGRAPKALLDVPSQSKISGKSSYQRNWISKISVDTIIEMTENSRIVKENEVNHDVLRDVRISKEEFDRIRDGFGRYRDLSPSIMLIDSLLKGPGLYESQLKSEEVTKRPPEKPL